MGAWEAGRGECRGEGVGGGGEGGEGERAGRMIQNIFPLPGATYTGVAKAPTGSHLASPEAAGEAAGFFMHVGVL